MDNFPPIPDYRPLAFAGKGSFGEVFLVEDVVGNRCALKLLRRDNFESQKDYEREFQALKSYIKLSREQEGVVSVHHLGGSPEEPFYYYVMDAADPSQQGEDYVPCTLKEKLSLSPAGLLPREVHRIACTLAEALAFLHRNGLVHRDIKPDNIIFIQGEPRLSDPGLVKDAEGEGSIAGTYGYLAPEGPGYSSDQYALGKTIYRMLTGKHAKDFPEMPTVCLSGEDSLLASVLNDICNKACEYDVKRRYSDIHAMEKALSQALVKAVEVGQSRKLNRRGLFTLGAAGVGVAATGYLVHVTQKTSPEIPVSWQIGGGKLAGWNHTLLIDPVGNVWGCGLNEAGQLGQSSKNVEALYPTLLLKGDIKAVASGDHHSLFLKEDGTVWGVGANDYGQLGLGDTEERDTPRQIPGVKQIRAISASGAHSMMLTKDGSLLVMGKQQEGRLGIKSRVPLLVPTLVKGATSGVSAIASGSGHNFFIRDKKLFGMGRNRYGRLGDGTSEDRYSPALVLDSDGVVFVATGYAHTLFAKEDGSLWGFGQNDKRQLGLVKHGHELRPVKIPFPSVPKALACGYYFSLVLAEDRTLYGCGSNGYGQLGSGQNSSPSFHIISTEVDAIWAGMDHSVYIKKGRVHTLGRNHHGQLGDGTLESRNTPFIWGELTT